MYAAGRLVGYVGYDDSYDDLDEAIDVAELAEACDEKDRTAVDPRSPVEVLESRLLFASRLRRDGHDLFADIVRDHAYYEFRRTGVA